MFALRDDRAPTSKPWVARLDKLELSIFLVEDWDGEPSNCAPLEHERIQWFSHGELVSLALAHSSYLDLFRQAFSR